MFHSYASFFYSNDIITQLFLSIVKILVLYTKYVGTILFNVMNYRSFYLEAEHEHPTL